MNCFTPFFHNTFFGVSVVVVVLLPLLNHQSSFVSSLSPSSFSTSSSSCAENNLIHAGKNKAELENIINTNTTTDRYLSWAFNHTEVYDYGVFIPSTADSCLGIAFHWIISSEEEEEEEMIHIAVAARISTKDGNEGGWVAIGFSETGGMRGADVLYFTTLSKTVIDAHILDYLAHPITDSRQDWVLNDYFISDEHESDDDGYMYVIFEASRKLDTNDIYDRPIVDDTSIYVADHRVIGAWGSSQYVGYHGNNRVRTSLQLYSSSDSTGGLNYETFKEEMTNRSENSVKLGLSNYAIPTRRTTYYEECFSADDLTEKGFFSDDSPTQYVVGYEFIIDPETVKYMHHILIFGSYGGCSNFAPVFTWTPGEEFSYFPDDAGMKFSINGGIKSLNIQYHVDNADGDSGKVDSGSGIRLYFSSVPVSNEIGAMLIGDPTVGLTGNSVGNGLTKYSFECPSSCTQSHLNQDITIVQEQLHMHSYGERIVNQVHRDGEIIHESHIDYWDFDQTGTPAPQNEPYLVKKGDSFKTICYYNSDSNTKFGLGSEDEMCMVLILYFPKQNLSSCALSGGSTCKSKFEGRTFLDSVSDLERVFGNNDLTVSPTTSPTKTPTHSLIAPSTEPTILPTASSTGSPTEKTTPSPTNSQLSSEPSTSEPTKQPSTSSSCDDSSLRFRVFYRGKTIFRDCRWVANKATIERCALDGVRSICPATCDSCSSCTDSTVRFKVDWNGRRIARDCIWVSNKATVMRCKLAGVAGGCRSTCRKCS